MTSSVSLLPPDAATQAGHAFAVSVAVLVARDPFVRRVLAGGEADSRFTILAELSMERPALRFQGWRRRGNTMLPGRVVEVALEPGWVAKPTPITEATAKISRSLAQLADRLDDTQAIIAAAAALAGTQTASVEFEIRDTLRRFGEAPLPA